MILLALYLKLRDSLGVIYGDKQFVSLFCPNAGQSAYSPGQLAMVTVMQFLEGLTDRQAADAVRARIDWKYMLGLELATATGINLVRLAAVLNEKTKGRTRISRFAQLFPEVVAA